jgi:predicted RND superfamily exporter protein
LGFFVWIEETALSEWIRGSPSLWGFPFILYLHTLGLAMVAGLSSAVALWLLVARQPAQNAPLLQIFPLIWAGLAINAVSGLLLLIAYPAKALTNPVFFIKLTAIAAGIFIVQWLQRELKVEAAPGQAPSAAKLKLAAASLLGLWLVATLTGRLLAYTHSIMMAREAVYF